jgi:hypothetical protein
MDISVYGTKNKKLIRDLSEAAEFYANILLDPRMVRSIELDIEIERSLEFEGMMISEDDKKNPRFFTIQLRNKKDDDDIFKTLAHEMVHLKQYAKNQLYKKFAPTKNKKGETLHTLWEGKSWKPKRNEHKYFDSPWEVEAFGREVGMFHRWIEYKNYVS